jgi:hypothetical protein
VCFIHYYKAIYLISFLFFGVVVLEGMQGSGDKSLSREIEKRIQRRFFIGANVSERVIIEDFLQQVFL